jgi:hypothetical protein
MSVRSEQVRGQSYSLQVMLTCDVDGCDFRALTIKPLAADMRRDHEATHVPTATGRTA